MASDDQSDEKLPIITDAKSKDEYDTSMSDHRNGGPPFIRFFRNQKRETL